MDPKIEELIALGGAECNLCGQRMLKADGCSWGYIKCGGKLYKRIKYGDEGFKWSDERCHDCGAKPGHYHHYNCDVEECPVCGGQLDGCDCEYKYSDGEGEDTTACYARAKAPAEAMTLEMQKQAAESAAKAFGYFRVATKEQLSDGATADTVEKLKNRLK